MKVLSLFSGIGGIDLGLERSGMIVVGQVEIDPFCRAVLKKHWPRVPCMEDVREVKGDEFGPIDIVAGGVPCQPTACGGKKQGKADSRWLWDEFVRIVIASGTDWFLAENPRGFLSHKDAPEVFCSLERSGYKVLPPFLLAADDLSAPHGRHRHWIMGYSDRVRQSRSIHSGELQAKIREISRDPTVGPVRTSWPPRPGEVDRIPVMVDGLPKRLAGFARRNALKSLGNSVVPQVVEVIGRAIMTYRSGSLRDS